MSFVRIIGIAAALFAANALAGGQIQTPLSASVRAVLQQGVADQPLQQSAFTSKIEEDAWLTAMSPRLMKRFPDKASRDEFLNTVHYEATRAGVDPELVLGLIEVESGFKKYAVSSVGARGFMQVMPFWVRDIGTTDQNLFHLRINLRYGCTILRHYINIERGDLFRALGRYNGSLGRAEYPNMVYAAWRHWTTTPRSTASNPRNPDS